MAHELANPLVAITQAVSVLRAGLTDADDLALADCLLAEGRRLRRFVQRAAAPAGSARASRLTAIDELVHGVVALARLDPRAPEDVRFHIKLAPDLTAVAMDPDGITQVLWNLVLNAIQAIDAGGNVTVIAQRSRDGRLGVEVRDDGRGLPPGDPERLLVAGVGQRRGGSGLGLAVSREIIESHGGRLTLSPSESGGARVRFWIPDSASARPAPSSRSGASCADAASPCNGIR